MMSSYATLVFSPLADALMASLASRTHEWQCWDMLQEEVFELEWNGSTLVRLSRLSSFVDLRIWERGNPTGTPIAVSLRRDLSASEVLRRLLGPERSAAGAGFLPSCRRLSSWPHPQELKFPLALHGLDSPRISQDLWELAPADLGALFAGQPRHLKDLRYRNSSGNLSHQCQKLEG